MTSIFRPEPEFTLRIPNYNKVDHLHGTMVEFGKFVLKYKPHAGADEPKLKMTISSEATLPEMINFFERFLQNAGYDLDNRSLVLAEDLGPVTCERHWDEFWEDANEDEALG